MTPARAVAVSCWEDPPPAPPSGRRLEVTGALLVLAAALGAAVTYL